MNSFTITVDIIFLIFIFLSFWLPYKQGKKVLAVFVTSILTFFVVLTIVTEMGYITTFLMIVIFAFSIIFLGYWTLVNLHFKKAAKIVVIIFSIIALLPFLSLALEDYFFFKSDAKKFLSSDQIILTDNFKIKSNHITGLTDLYQKFELEISYNDKQRILNQIRNSKYFDTTSNEDFDMLATVGSGLVKKTFKDYETNDYIIRKTYQKLRIGYVSDYDIISISKKDNTLIFERIND